MVWGKLESLTQISRRFKGKPCCIFVVLASGRGGEELLRLAAYEIERIGMKLILHDSWPFLGVPAKGEGKGEVLEDKKGIEDCRKIISKLMNSVLF